MGGKQSIEPEDNEKLSGVTIEYSRRESWESPNCIVLKGAERIGETSWEVSIEVRIPLSENEGDIPELIGKIREEPLRWAHQYEPRVVSIHEITTREKVTPTREMFLASSDPLKLADQLHSDPTLLENYLGCTFRSPSREKSKWLQNVLSRAGLSEPMLPKCLVHNITAHVVDRVAEMKKSPEE